MQLEMSCEKDFQAIWEKQSCTHAARDAVPLKYLNRELTLLHVQGVLQKDSENPVYRVNSLYD